MKIKVTVCELRADERDFNMEWERLINHVQKEKSHLVLLPEMSFGPWIFWRKKFDSKIWNESLAHYDRWVTRIQELGAKVVIGSRPAVRKNKKVNEGFVWTNRAGYKAAHIKYYLPNEAGFWEKNWYERSKKRFRLTQIGRILLGVQICSDIWFLDNARKMGLKGAHILVNPRVTRKDTLDKWLAVSKVTAMVSGAYLLSSNHVGNSNKKIVLGGRGWIINPEGKVIARTSKKNPFITTDIDLSEVSRAKRTYPRYLSE